MKPQVIWSQSQNPYVNAAHEEWLYTHMAPKTPIYFLWQNTDSVCIGRYQNPWSELNIRAIENEHIPVVRRISGGGTVFHDLGNLNISYMHPGSEYDKKIRMLPVIDYLRADHLISLSERGDGLISVDGIKYKFSGSAYKNRHSSSLHHFTLLLNSDLDRLWRFLKKNKSDLFQGRSMPSTRTEVRNLNIADPKLWAQNWATHQKFDWHEISSDQMDQEFLNKFSSYEWNYEETPEFKFFDTRHEHFLLIQKGMIVAENDQYFEKALMCHSSVIDQLRKQVKTEYFLEDLF